MGKTNPKRTQNEPKLVRRRRILNSDIERSYKTDPHFWLKNPKANFFANASIVSLCKLEGYEMNLDFWLKIPKPKTKPIFRRPLKLTQVFIIQ